MSRQQSFTDERWRRNNKALRPRHNLSPGDRREVLRTAVMALIGLAIIVSLTVTIAILT